MAIATTSLNDAKHRIRRIRTGKYLVYTCPRYRHWLYKLRTRENQHHDQAAFQYILDIRYQLRFRMLTIERFENRSSNRIIR